MPARTYARTCALCAASFTAATWDKKYCSPACKVRAFATGFADYDCGTANCAHCKLEFKRKHLRHAYCSVQCKREAAKRRGSESTDKQYERLSGNWQRYFARLCAAAGREALTVDDLLRILERQKCRCALTGTPLTCTLVRGERTWTNASIDRIVAGGPYTAENVRLTCARINVLRGNMTDDEFVYWCNLVVSHMEKSHAT